MTIEERKKRRKLYKDMLKNLDAIRVMISRSIVTETLNIKELMKREKMK